MNTRYWMHVAGRALATLACGIIVSTAVQAAAPPNADVLVSQLASVTNVARPFPWLLTGGQPDANALATLAKAGVRDIIDMRTSGETRDIDERALAETMGLCYLPIPTSSADFSDAKFTAFRHHLIAHGPRNPLFIHCASGNRVGAALLPWLVLDQGMTEDAALKLAREIGLRDREITRRAQEYIQSQVRELAARPN